MFCRKIPVCATLNKFPEGSLWHCYDWPGVLSVCFTLTKYNILNDSFKPDYWQICPVKSTTFIALSNSMLSSLQNFHKLLFTSNLDSNFQNYLANSSFKSSFTISRSVFLPSSKMILPYPKITSPFWWFSLTACSSKISVYFHLFAKISIFQSFTSILFGKQFLWVIILPILVREYVFLLTCLM